MTPLLIWDVAGWLLTDRPVPWYAWLVQAWPVGSETGLYGRGSIFTFIGVLPVIVPPLVLPATLVGVTINLSPRTTSPTCHARICQVLIAAIPLSILVGHSVLRWLGKFGTFGEACYLLICACSGASCRLSVSNGFLNAGLSGVLGESRRLPC